MCLRSHVSNHSIYELLSKNYQSHKIDTFIRNIRVNASNVFIVDSGPNRFYLNLYPTPSGVDINFHCDSAVRN